jgi:hypothetical protein
MDIPNALLGDLDKFTLQTYLNDMAPAFSTSVLAKVRVYLNSILGEAVELEMLLKNPATKLAVPKSGKRAATKHLTPEQIPIVLFHLSDRDRLVVRMFLVLGLRPGEMFALRWDDKQQNSLRIDSSITDGIEVETNTEGSDAACGCPAPSRPNWNSGARPARTQDPRPLFFRLREARRSARIISFSASSRKPGAKHALMASRIRCCDAPAQPTWPSSRVLRTSRPICATPMQKPRWNTISSRFLPACASPWNHWISC